MKPFLATIAFLIAAIVVAPAAAEGPACNPQALLSLVNTALAGQASLSKFAVRRYGAKASFLKIRYGGLKEEEAAALLDGLLDAKVQGADELALAWSIHTLGDHAALARLTKDRAGLLTSSLGTSAIRALLLTKDGPEILMDRIAATPKDRLGTVANAIMIAMLDQPDALKEKIAALAEARDIPVVSPVIAAQLIATQSDSKAWDAFAKRRAAKGDITELTRTAYWMPGLVGKPALKRDGQTAEMDAMRADVHMVAISAAFEPEFDFLMTFLNQTGDTKSAAAAAKALKAAVEAGEVRRNGTFDAAWLLVYRELVKATSDRARIDGLLAAISFQPGRYASSGRFTLGDIIDRLLTVEALTPFLTGTSSDLPNPPADLSEAMKAEWSNWTSMAPMVKEGRVPEGLGDMAHLFGIVAELLYAKGDIDGLRALIAKAPAGETRVFTATDFATRLDRQCNSYLAHPAEAVLVSGQPIFKFDTK
ncbi:hypothetical protein [Pararhizobium sp.]|uniref:hypothetical protein n=1 Tax=Pararhizobium sp. TaxID=1977563 RepID=UPI002720B087|nr:hypothetical protein [Pararhizobium sp.]MDO9417587.1 hypothetical protein [Pararhizobium sp.]